MVYLALGVLAITFSITVYKYRSSTNSQDFLSWRQKESTTKVANGPTNVVKSNEDSKRRNDIPSFTIEGIEHEPPTGASTKEQSGGQTTDSHMKPTAPAQSRAKSEEATMPPPVRKTSNATPMFEQPAPNVMQPPSLPSQAPPAFKIPPKPTTTLRPPPSAASTLRGPPSGVTKPSTSSLAPSSSTLAPSSRPSKKVILEPGHSPLDWAHLTANPPTPTFLRGDDVPQDLIRVPPSAVRYHSGRKGKDAWGVYQGKVYNLSPYMKFHPGGVDQLMKGAGKEREGEKLFNEIHPWVSWENMLGECLIGILVSENEVKEGGVEQENKLEEMD